MKEINLKGKKALVTGGSQGIGAAICKQLAECGADIFINHFQSQDQAEDLASQIRKEFGVSVEVGGADVSVKNEVREMFLQMDQKLGNIDILVNNAGCETVCHVLDLPEDDWQRIMDVNLKGPMLCSQEAGKRMVEKGGGVIINISSIHDTVPRKGLIHYCASKAGLKMFSKCLSLELIDHNVRVVSVSPGAIETEMNRDEINRFGRDKFENWIPKGRLGQVEDVANAVCFLASDIADYIHGADLYIDGAYMNNTIPYDPRPPRK
jgi:NAD(P)-dependent dehydrogenase (short-subunit alcohol dehydrogenase family)